MSIVESKLFLHFLLIYLYKQSVIDRVFSASYNYKLTLPSLVMHTLEAIIKRLQYHETWQH